MKYLHICHYCIDYRTYSLSDMIKHYKRKSSCKCSTFFSYEDANILSRKKYTFNFDNTNLSNEDYLYIITHYKDNINIIDKDFKNITQNNLKNIDINNINPNNIKLNNNSLDNNSLDNNSLDNIDLSNIDLNNFFIKKILESINKSKLFIKNNDTSDIEDLKKSNDIDNINILNSDDLVPIDIKTYSTKKIYENTFFNKSKNIYYCGNCESEYTHLNNLRRHRIKDTCYKRKETNTIIDTNAKRCNKIIEKENKKQETINQQINYNNCNIQNNNNNNTNNSTYNLNVRDFVHDRYDVSHIKDDFYLQKDFFLYHNFLRAIMENKNNQNIFFSNDEAIIYTDKELNKMSSDKAGYLVLDKLSQSFDQIFYKNDKETQEHYKFIQKYYYLVKGQYINDTIFKDYDINEQKFIYTSNSRLFRSRDKYLAKMVSTLSPIKNEVRERMSVSLDQINDIPKINPNIENYASVKMRYRDLKNKD